MIVTDARALNRVSKCCIILIVQMPCRGLVKNYRINNDKADPLLRPASGESNYIRSKS